MDPYTITLAERARFEQQFAALKPNNGIITGEQAKDFFLQSQLPPAILGIIWGLADTDADGKMNINEFSIACKLINLKLRGFEIPKVLSPSMQALVSPPVAASLAGISQAKPPIPPLPSAMSNQPLIPGISSMPPATIPPPRPSPVPMNPVNRVNSPPVATISPIPSPPSQINTPVSRMHGVTSPPLIPMTSEAKSVGLAGTPAMMTSQPLIPTQTLVQNSVQSMVSARPVIPPQPIIPPQPPMIPPQSMIPSQPAMPSQPILPAQKPLSQPLIGMTGIPPVLPMQTAAPTQSVPVMTTSVQPSALVGLSQPPQSQTIIPQQSIQPPASVKTLEKVGSLESPVSSGSPLVEWAVPQASKLKYTQLFNTTDKARTGFLSGAQARNILLASQLPQPVLAQIWALADMDSDGKLSCEEFVLALHLCDLARSGDTIPATLPPNLIPPTLRRQRNNSLTVSEQGDPLAGISSVTFEDKRKENFEKGQAELERRRKALLETQRKEQEERERKEREEREKQEKIRLEQERKRQEEFERQVERQRELEKAKEEERKRAQEQREAARREMERQRQIEWEKQRCQELQTQRQKQQEQVLSLKAKNQTLTIELSQLNDKVKDLSRQISETRCGVTGVKSTIDGMRATRDEEMAELNRLKGLLKQQNQKLVALSQQKAKLEAQGKLGKDIAGEEQARLAFNNKQVTIKNLREKVLDLEEQVKVKKVDVENNNAQLDGLKQELLNLISDCEEIYSRYADKRNKICEVKSSSRAQDIWGDGAWDTTPSWPDTTTTSNADTAGYRKYRALYEFVARNTDELSFQPGDIIMVPEVQNAEPGWLSGELRGASGWFPESYVEPADGSMENTLQSNIQTKTHLEGIAEVAENVSENDFVIDEGPPLPIGSEPILGLGQPVNKTALAEYNFSAKKTNQISFTKGDTLQVSELQDQWCYGELTGQEGWFPKSYVTLSEAVVSNTTQALSDGALPPEQQEYYVSMYPYQSEEPGDLTFDQGEMILVVGKEGDWWTGVIGTRSGIFPSNYVQKAEQQNEQVPAVIMDVPEEEPIVIETKVEQQTVQPTHIEPQTTGGSERSATPDFLNLSAQAESGSGEESESKVTTKVKKPEIATVIAPYQATSNEQLNLQRGQLIMIRKKTTTGWWEGELQAKGRKRQIGWFPASYVKLLGGGGSGTRTVQASNKASESATPSEPIGERVIALYQYVAQNEDELNFEKDDIILVVSKDEPSWWKGEINGATGLFPSNYVGPLSSNNTRTKTKIKLSKEEKERQHCIKELILTEQAYINDMSIVHDVFEKPLIESKVLPPDQIRAIFINWRDIIECNYTFLRALRVRREMSEGGVIRMIGDILCENLPRMTVYVRFCSCQLSAATLLQTLTEGNKNFRSLSKRCQSDPRTQGLPLSSFLIKPMQRITKYHLFIQKILDHTPVGHPDRQYMEEALSKAEELCLQVNEGVREKENSERLEWLQTHVLTDTLSEPLIFNSLTNSVGPRKLIHFGVLWKTKSGKELVGFLMNDFLLLAQPNRPLGHQFSFERHQNVLFRIYKEPLLLNETVILNTPDGNDSVELKLEFNKIPFNLSTATQHERNLWIKKLNEIQNELRENETAKFQRQQSKQASFGACGRILVVVLEGSKLKPPTAVKREVFCEVSMGSQEHRTPAVYTPQYSDPKWNTSMQFLVKDLKEDVLCITVRDKGHYSPDEFLGRTEVRVSEIYQATQSLREPIKKVLKLHEVRSGQVALKLDLQLFR